MIAVIDYGMGNLRSVVNAIEMAGGNPEVVSDPSMLQAAERIVLPGVGAFGDCIANLTRTGFAETLDREVRGKGRPILGICLGMQVMARRGVEFGEHAGLGWFAAEVLRIQPADPALRVPQVGWNDLNVRREHPVLRGLPKGGDVYFVHSFQMCCDDPADILATCDYGGAITAAVAKDNIVATQFHPEKSQDVGLALLANFLRWNP